MARWWDLTPEEKKRIGSEMERQHELKGRNIVSLSAARHRRDWNRHVATWCGDGDDSVA